MPPTTDLLDGLTPEQQDAVRHTDGPLLILAGAGSGKTRVVTRRIARLVRDGVSPEAILAITFTNKAAGEMRERVEELLHGRWSDRAGGAGRPHVSTFHAFCVRLLREHAERLGLPRRFSILDPEDQSALIREAAVSLRLDVKKHPPAALAHAIGRAKERLDDRAFAREAKDELERAAARVLPLYRQLQRRRGALDFEDLVAEAVRLLEGRAEVHDLLQERLRYVLIDEYQDTNHSQYRLARLLAGERRNLAVCGDPDQSIYGWRGADMGNILRFEEDYPGAKVVLLERNYRSTATILRAANHLIAHNAVRRDKQLRPVAEDGGPIEVARLLDAGLEADYVARRVEEAIAEGVYPGEVAVIYRAGVHAEGYEAALLMRGVPCQTVGAASFFARREVKDALAWIRAALNPKDDLAALRALRSRSRGVGERTLDKVHAVQRETGASILEVCGEADAVPGLTKAKRAAIGGFAGLVRDLARSGSVEELVTGAVERTGLGERLAADERAEERQRSMQTLRDAAREADRRTRGGGAAAAGQQFLDRLALLDAQDQADDRPDRVVLTTAHAAKGLEFDVVFVVGLEEGLFPHRRALEEGGLEEERRLAYVALTRARQRLVLTYAGVRSARDGGIRPASTFLYELPGDLLWDPERKKPFELPERDPEERAAALERPERRGRRALASVPSAGAGEAPPLWRRGLVKRRRVAR